MTLQFDIQPTTHHIEVEYEGQTATFVFKDITKRTSVHMSFAAKDGLKALDDFVISNLSEIKGIVDQTGNKWQAKNFHMLPLEITNQVEDKFIALVKGLIGLLEEDSEDVKKQSLPESSEDSSSTEPTCNQTSHAEDATSK